MCLHKLESLCYKEAQKHTTSENEPERTRTLPLSSAFSAHSAIQTKERAGCGGAAISEADGTRYGRCVCTNWKVCATKRETHNIR